MTSSRSPAARLTRVAGTGVAYLIANGFAVALTRFGGGVAFLWVANAVLLAALTTSVPKRWPLLIGVCWVAAAAAAAFWGLGWQAAPFIATVNVAEPLIGAMLVVRWGVHRSGLDSARHLALFVLAAGIIAPASSGIAGAIVVCLASGTRFVHNYGNWCIGHALGALTFTPIFAQVASGEVRRWLVKATTREIGEAALLLALVAATSAAVFAQSRLPRLFLPMLPLMLITFRVGRLGSSMAVVVIAAVGAALTLSGSGPINLVATGVGQRLQFLQFYLAVTVMTVLPVAADLARRHRLFERLRDSEARFRLMTENSTDIVLNLDVNGVIRYASPSIALLGGYDPALLVGRPSIELVDPEHRERVRAVHVQALGNPLATFSVEYRGVVPGEEEHWFETRTRAVIDESGHVQGVVSAVRDTSMRRRNEVELAQAAHTDPLTGICNRRAFDRDLGRRLAKLADGQPGCVAVFDLDHFKRINDTFGHAIGDEVLRAFARTAEAHVRGGDMFARIGGEEFGLIFAALSVDQAQIVCERIRVAVAAARVRAGDWPVAVTVSIGIGTFIVGDDVDSVMRRADRALYRSKEHGRNRTSLAA